MLTEINRSKAENELADCQHRNMKARRRLEIKNNAMCDVNEESSLDADCQRRNMKAHRRLEIKNNAMCDVNEESSVDAIAATP